MGNSILSTPMGRANKDLDQQETAIASTQAALGRQRSPKSKARIINVKEVNLDNGRRALVGKDRITRIDVVNPHSLNAGDQGWMSFIEYRKRESRGEELGVAVEEKKVASGDSALTEESQPKEEPKESLDEQRERAMADKAKTKPEDRVASAYDLTGQRRDSGSRGGESALTSEDDTGVKVNSKGVSYIDLGSRAVVAGDIAGIKDEGEMEALAGALGVRRGESGNPMFSGMSDEDIRKKAAEMLKRRAN